MLFYIYLEADLLGLLQKEPFESHFLGINYIVSVINRCKVNKNYTSMTQSYYLLAIVEIIPFLVFHFLLVLIAVEFCILLFGFWIEMTNKFDLIRIDRTTIWNKNILPWRTNLTENPFLRAHSSCKSQIKYKRKLCNFVRRQFKIAMIAKYFCTLVFIFIRVKSSSIFPENWNMLNKKTLTIPKYCLFYFPVADREKT